MINTIDLARNLKGSILEITGSKVNIPICEKILLNFIDKLSVNISSGHRVRLGDIGLFRLEVLPPRIVSGNLPGSKPEYKVLKRISIQFQPSEIMKKLVENNHKTVIKHE